MTWTNILIKYLFVLLCAVLISKEMVFSTEIGGGVWLGQISLNEHVDFQRSGIFPQK